MGKQGRIKWILAALVLLLAGCGKQESLSFSGETDKIEETFQREDQSKPEEKTKEQPEGKEEIKEEKPGTGAAEKVEMEEKERKEPAAANVNPEMEAMTAGELVSDMKIGWNLGNTMDSTNPALAAASSSDRWETAWGNPVTSRELIDTVIGEGFNIIRIPVSWDDHILDSGNWEIEESWMDRVQEIVDYAYSSGAYVILNTHHESWYEPYYENQERASEILAAVWAQIAERFQDYDEHLIFEGMNEPRKIGTSVEWTGGDQEGWDVVNELNAVFIQTVRESGGNNPYRILMIPAYAANCWEGLKHIEVPQDDKIIISVHAYEPYDFALNVQGRSTWDQDTSNIDMIMDSLDTLFISKGIPVIIGEFGAMRKDGEKNEEERAAWAQYYVSAASKIGVPCIWWDNGAFSGNGELFGLIDRETCEWKYPLVLEGLKKGTVQAD